MNLKERFNRLSSIDEVLNLKNESSSKDGEYSWFEEKGIKPKFTKDCKKNISKEICAFSNTYGGIIFCHFGDDNTIKKYSGGSLQDFHTKFEDWLRTSIEPRSFGFDLKIVDDIFLIYIPESKNKPHRANDSKYYYRNITQSCVMPEIMISSMYRSQDFLETECTLTCTKENNSLNIILKIQNNSNLSGSMPKIRYAIANSGEMYFIGDNLQEPAVGHFDDIVDSLNGIKLFYIESNNDIQNLLLYPNDILTFKISANKTDTFLSNILLVVVDYYFKEANKKRHMFLLKTTDDNLCEQISCAELDSQETINMFLYLRDKYKESTATE